MTMFGLYPDIKLQLIDGGLNTNQSIRSFLKIESVNTIVSDAGWQLAAGNAALNKEGVNFFPGR